ncbi:prolyl 3-hydroxylase OGFOD1 [Caerostris extrusa]|uniref:Prolyl 3-hydroxylase OGFOD1 n=1 Tax=Caerostris extrusa TaxID=172846 RepID=A0AAV4Y6C3_CAEEX|nr:prolyl 3-hydroxylase OGFOD1 [Caerostris extrusa]
MTGLSLHPASTKENVQMAGINSSIRKWSPGSYALLHDQSFLDFPILNVALCFNCIDWLSRHGGSTTYVAKSDLDKENMPSTLHKTVISKLMTTVTKGYSTCGPKKPNTLAMVYITGDTTSYVKYINCQANERSNPCFHDIFAIYREEE